MCKCACFDWFKKLFGLKKNCCCSGEEKKDMANTENMPAEPVSHTNDNNEVNAPVSAQDQASEIPAEEKKEELFEQK
jgi:hypothetical protein